MMSIPNKNQLRQALSAAESAHHGYELNYLYGERDEQWAGWYSAYILGRLGEFTTPTLLAQWLENVSAEGDWAENAAIHVLTKLQEAK